MKRGDFMRLRGLAALVAMMMVALFVLPVSAQQRAQQSTMAQAQQQEAQQRRTSPLPDRIIRPMRAVDPITLRAEGVSIRLWGIKPAQSGDTPLELRALDLMDGLIQEQQVNCKIEGGAIPELIGRCTVQSSQDLALELLTKGFVVVDRHQTYNTVFATNYAKAEESARAAGNGVWAFVKQAEDGTGGVPKWMQSEVLLPLVLFGGPLLGLLVVAFVLWRFMDGISSAQTSENRQAEHKEALLQTRERQVLVSTLEGELAENKNKIEAFLVIYGDMLRSLKEGTETPKYQQVGDIVQKHPSFSKTVFEANVPKLNLLEMKLAGHVSKLYSALPKEQEYINLDQNVPLETAVKLVEKVLKDAENLLAPINQVIDELQAAAKLK
jgi:endonuclease YncB( thermonuclease family)